MKVVVILAALSALVYLVVNAQVHWNPFEHHEYPSVNLTQQVKNLGTENNEFLNGLHDCYNPIEEIIAKAEAENRDVNQLEVRRALDDARQEFHRSLDLLLADKYAYSRWKPLKLDILDMYGKGYYVCLQMLNTGPGQFGQISYTIIEGPMNITEEAFNFLHGFDECRKAMQDVAENLEYWSNQTYKVCQNDRKCITRMLSWAIMVPDYTHHAYTKPYEVMGYNECAYKDIIIL